MIGILDAAKIAGGIALGALIAAPTSHYLGKREGRQQAATAALEKTIQHIEAREKTNAEISSADSAALCDHYGLPDAERIECVRRVAEASAKP